MSSSFLSWHSIQSILTKIGDERKGMLIRCNIVNGDGRSKFYVNIKLTECVGELKQSIAAKLGDKKQRNFILTCEGMIMREEGKHEVHSWSCVELMVVYGFLRVVIVLVESVGITSTTIIFCTSGTRRTRGHLRNPFLNLWFLCLLFFITIITATSGTATLTASKGSCMMHQHIFTWTFHTLNVFF